MPDLMSAFLALTGVVFVCAILAALYLMEDR
jgi:hypothetical protein